MRFVTPKAGDKRHVTKFLWLPKTLGRETRWLETATWLELAVETCTTWDGRWTTPYAYWRAEEFVSDDRGPDPLA